MNPKRQSDPGAEPLRALPRMFVEGASAEGPIDLPEAELLKLRKVLRLEAGSQIAVLPNDGSVLRCTLEGSRAHLEQQFWPQTESKFHLAIGQALPKGDRLEEIVRACTELGVARFVLFHSDRSVMRWDDRKTAERIRRLESIVRESCEVSFRTILPKVEWVSDLREALGVLHNVQVLSESESVSRVLGPTGVDCSLVAGPEGGWSAAEHELIGSLAVSLGPRVLRVEHAAPAAAAVLLIPHNG